MGILKFIVADALPARTELRTNHTYLCHTSWDDWFSFATSYNAFYVDESRKLYSLGVTKIGKRGLKPSRAAEITAGHRTPDLPEQFNSLESQYFSLGQDPQYYSELEDIGSRFREDFLRAMNDIAFDEALAEEVANEKVTRVSLLREVSAYSLREQYRRIARGGATLTPYSFKLVRRSDTGTPLRLQFSVTPGSKPPTNIHVLIGRNGVGKSKLLNDIARAVVATERTKERPVREALSISDISNVVSVSFSAFDTFRPPTTGLNKNRGVTYNYIGLKKVGSSDNSVNAGLSHSDKAGEAISDTKGHSALSREMKTSARACLQGARHQRWIRALRLLEADPIFASIGVGDLFENEDEDEAMDRLPDLFRRLSSGHKIVLLTIAKLVETVQEKSLVLIDEPEGHLHPPLLSALIRAISDLLTNRNGVAIVATHSPVVLQEVPRSCAWKLSRSGSIVSAERPTIETFGENVGTLTDEVFGLEVTSTGFHKMLADVAHSAHDYESALDQFGGQVGTEGRAILRAMMYARGAHVAS